MARISKEEKDRIRSKIIEVSSKYFLEDGFEETSTKKIAQEVGIAEGTLFNYFDSKAYLFLEAIGFAYETNSLIAIDTDVSASLAEVLAAHMKKSAGMMLKVPKGILMEFVIASIKMAKKHPKRFHQFAELDFRYMREVESYLKQLQEQGSIDEVDTKLLSEIVYGIMAYEILMYLYDKDKQLDDMYQTIKTKISIVLKGYIK